MLVLAVRHHVPGRQFRPAVQEPYPLPLYYPIVWAISYHPPSVCGLGLSDIYVTWLAGHENRLVNIFYQYNLVKEACQYFQGLLGPGWS